MDILNRLIRYRRWRPVREFLHLYCIDIPASVRIGSDFNLVHRGFGTVIHPRVTIGDRVTIYHNVTIGRGDAHLPEEQSSMERIDVGDDAILFPGVVVLGGEGVTRVGDGTIVAANAVLTKSTGVWEVWAGMPAKKIGTRPRPLSTKTELSAQAQQA